MCCFLKSSTLFTRSHVPVLLKMAPSIPILSYPGTFQLQSLPRGHEALHISQILAVRHIPRLKLKRSPHSDYPLFPNFNRRLSGSYTESRVHLLMSGACFFASQELPGCSPPSYAEMRSSPKRAEHKLVYFIGDGNITASAESPFSDGR